MGRVTEPTDNPPTSATHSPRRLRRTGRLRMRRPTGSLLPVRAPGPAGLGLPWGES